MTLVQKPSLDPMRSRLIILGSRSPRRQQLLSSILPAGWLRILPPKTSDELTFEDTRDDSSIAQRLQQNVQMKHDDVRSQLEPQIRTHGLTSTNGDGTSLPVIVTADTLVIATDSKQQRIVLGQPAGAEWRQQVCKWFTTLLSGRTHSVWTCFQISQGQQQHQQIVRSEVLFQELTDSMIEWYLSTEESLGKAGGYAIQGHGAALIGGLQGSLTNVIGLPVTEVAAALKDFGIRCYSVGQDTTKDAAVETDGRSEEDSRAS
jgi:septum formation protein